MLIGHLHIKTLTAGIAVMGVLAFANIDAHAAIGEQDNLLTLSLEELTNIRVTSVSKKAENENEAAAAISVITQEDIRRSGATALPELFRMVPGMTVTKSGSHNWTVTARGFNSQFSNKLLVLIDGRTIYSPLFSGVFWDLQDTMLEDIERIEIIRGPGATLWGANAVNGVINIITKSAKDTQDGVASFVAGNRIQGIGSVRYGTKLDESSNDSYVRAYAKQTQYRSEFTTTGKSANDNWKKSQAGFRTDSTLSSTQKLTVQGDIYAIDQDTNYTFPDVTVVGFTGASEGTKSRGFNLLTRYEHTHNDVSQSTLQMYFDNVFYKTGFFNDLNNTLDIDFQNIWSKWKRHEIVWGLGYRLLMGENSPASQQYSLSPNKSNDQLFNAFIQDKITLITDKLSLTLGSKFEHNDYTGFEVQPSARVAWLLSKNQTLWASVSRAVRTPSRFTRDGTLSYTVSSFFGFPILAQSAVNPYLKAETLTAYEAGYRIQPTRTSSIDIATFYNSYKNLFRDAQGTITAPPGGTYLLVPLIPRSTAYADSIGAELSGKWNVLEDWQLSTGYSYINAAFSNKAALSSYDKHPKHQFNLRSHYRFDNGVEMTNTLYLVDRLRSIGIPAYQRFDTRIGYEPTEGVELSVVVNNLFDDRHKEFSPFLYRYATEIGRSVYANATLEF